MFKVKNTVRFLSYIVALGLDKLCGQNFEHNLLLAAISILPAWYRIFKQNLSGIRKKSVAQKTYMTIERKTDKINSKQIENIL